MNYHYLDSNNQPAGPAALEDIRALARDGRIAGDPMICAEGTSDWKLLSVLDGKPKGAMKALPFSGTILADFVGRLVRLAGGILSPALVEKSLGLARHFGQYAVLLGGALGLIATIVVAIRHNSFATFLLGVVFVVALAVAQYAATRFLGASDSLIATTPSRLSSLAFLECLGVLTVLCAVGTLLGGLFVTIQARDATVLIPTVLVTAFFTYFGAIALHPHLASVESGSGSAGEEAIGILAFGLKALLKMVPLAFALLAVVGSVALLVGIFAPRSGLGAMLGMIPSVPEPGFGNSLAGLGIVFAATLLPMLAYFAYLVAALPLELWRAILSLPGKLDLLRRAEQAA